MEKFCQHIEKLLAQHDYVVVPNLGGFVVQLQSAELLSEYITPPLSTIGFNPLMRHADGLLAIEIARSQQISYRLAMEYIEKEVEGLKSKLQANENVPFGSLGFFYHNEQGNLLFTPSVKAEFLPQNFELSNLYVSQRNTQIKNEKPKLTITFPSTRIFKYASVAILIVGLFFVSPRVNDTRQVDSANLLTSAFYNSKPDSSVSVLADKTIQPADTATIDEPENFHVIVASLPTQLSADEVCEKLTAAKFPKAHVVASARTFRVAIQSFSDRDEAIQFMEELRKTDSQFETAWVLCK